MTTLTIELQPDAYEQLADAAKRSGKQPSALAAEWLTERLPVAAQFNERERVRAALRTVGLLTELGPELQKRAEDATMSLEEVQEALDQVGGNIVWL